MDDADTATASCSTRNVDERRRQFGDYRFVAVLFQPRFMANMSTSWSVTNSLMAKVLFLTDRALRTATERLFFDVLV